jgi:hypothetical protein
MVSVGNQSYVFTSVPLLLLVLAHWRHHLLPEVWSRYIGNSERLLYRCVRLETAADIVVGDIARGLRCFASSVECGWSSGQGL